MTSLGEESSPGPALAEPLEELKGSRYLFAGIAVASIWVAVAIAGVVATAFASVFVAGSPCR